MKFEFIGATTSGLRVLANIPSAPMGRLRGRNGIGKSVALNLISLCANPAGNPYLAFPDSWRSLRASLGENFLVRASGHDVGTIEWRLEPQKWQERPADFTYDRIGTLSVDGRLLRPRAYAENPLLEVVKLSGGESLLSVLELMVSEDSQRFQSAVGPLSQRLQEGVLEADRAQSYVDALHPRHRAEITERISHLSEEATVLQRRREALYGRRDVIQKVVDMTRRIEAIDADLPVIDQEVSTARSQLAEDLSKERALQGKLDSGWQEQAGLEQLRDEIGNLQRLQDRRIKFFATAEAAAASQAAAAGLPADPEDLRDLRDGTLSILRELTQRREELLRSAPTYDLVSEMADVLEAKDPPDDTLIVRDEEGEIRAGRLRGGLDSRKRELGREESARALLQVEKEVAGTQRRLAEVEDVLEAVVNRDRKGENLREVSRELREKTKQLQTMSPDLAALSAKRDQVASRIAELRVRLELLRARRDQLTGGRAPEEWRRTRDDLVGDLELQQDLQPELRDVTSELHRTDATMAAIERSIDELQGELHERKKRAAAAAAALEKRGLPVSPETGPVEVEYWRRRLETVKDKFNRQVRMISAFANAWEALAQSLLSTGRSRGRADAETSALVKWYSQRLVTQYSDAAMRRALFDGGELLDLNLWSRQATWRSGQGVVHRPLESFSSGQMVFAYTRARLAALPARSAGRFRLLALDEFGAFLDEEARQLLVDFLATQTLGVAADQILLVLPAGALPANQEVAFDAL